MLKRVRRKSVADSVIEQLMDQIASGAWVEGDRIPAEHELAEMLGVGRTSVREALKAMQVLGLVTRGNEGTYVADVLPLHVLDDRLRLRLSAADLETAHLYEARRVLEGEIARLAAERCVPSDVDELEAVWTQMKDLPLEDLDGYLDLDMTFHTRLCEIAGNPVLTQMWTIAFEAHRARRAQVKRARQLRVSASSGRHERPRSTHALLLNALREGHGDDARSVVHEVLSHLEKAMFTSTADRADG